MEIYAILAGLFLVSHVGVYFWGRSRGCLSERGRITAWLTELAESGQDAQEAEDEARRNARGRMLDVAADILRDEAETDG